MSLVELLKYFDYKQRTIPSAEEINQAFEINKNIFLKREGSSVYFVKADATQEIENKVTDDELKRAGKQHTKEFWKLHKQLNSKN